MKRRDPNEQMLTGEYISPDERGATERAAHEYRDREEERRNVRRIIRALERSCTEDDRREWRKVR